MNHQDYSTKVSTVFGSLLTIFIDIEHKDLIKTIVLASIGGLSSYIATLLLKHLIILFKQRHRK